MVQMRQSNKCGSVRNDEIINLHLGSGAALESTSPASCKTPATLIDSIRPIQSKNPEMRLNLQQIISYCLDLRISKFQSQLRDENVYRIPLRYFTELAKINFPVKTDFRIKRHLETYLKKLFEAKKVLAAGADIPSPDAKIIFTKTPFIQYEQLILDKNFRQYLKTIMVSKKILCMGSQKTPIEKTYEINLGQDSINIDFQGSNRQFSWLEILMVYDKSDKHATI